MKHSFSRLMALTAASAMVFAACSSTATASLSATSSATESVAPATATAPAQATPTPISLPSQTATGTPAASAPGLAGAWKGTWKDTTPDTSGGTFVVTFTQLGGSSLAGTIAVSGTPCLTSGTVTGAVNGSTITFGAVSGKVQIAYDGTISGTKMQGTYSAPLCGDAKGDWSATKS